MIRWLLNLNRMINVFRVLFIAAVFGVTVPLYSQPGDEIAAEIWNFTMSFPKADIAQTMWNACEDEHDFVENFERFLPEGV